MKIEKVNENQIRCTLTREDLASRELKISELAYGTEKAKSLFRDMMQQANFEFGFEADFDETGFEETLLDNVIEFKVSLPLRNDWVNKWDTRENRLLPKGIKVIILLENISGIQEKYEILTVPDIAND